MDDLVAATPDTDDEVATAIERMKRWTPSAQEKARELIETRSRSKHKPFYCPQPGCNGEPHGDWAWPHARADQHPPSMREFWQTWLYMAGRGAGKTRSAAELCHVMSDKVPRMALVAQTGPDGRDTMVEGELSGIMATARPGNTPEWEPSKKRLSWPNGCIGIVYSAEEPSRLRGPQNGFAWVDEAAHMANIEDVWSNLTFTLRLGIAPRIVVTTTPTATPWIKQKVKEAGQPASLVRLTRVSTEVNRKNLSATYTRQVIDPLRGTRLGRQEIDAEVLEDVEGALWTSSMFENDRYWPQIITPQMMERIVVAVDPAGTSTRRSDETGIIVIGRIGSQLYVIADGSGKYSPSGWANRALALFELYGADAIIAEKNYGGEMVEATFRNIDANAPIRMVTSRRGKAIRAEPIVAAYEQHNVHHPHRDDLSGRLPLDIAEDQMCFIAGTLVETRRGHIAIEHVTTRDEVMTREGWAPVAWAGETTRRDTLTEVTHARGCVVSTPWHRIWTSNRGFVPAHRVLPSDSLVVRPSPASTAPRSPGAGVGGTGCHPAITATPRASSFIGQFGKRITARSPKVTSSTIETIYLETIGSRISSPSSRPAIVSTTLRRILASLGSRPTTGLRMDVRVGSDASPVLTSVTAAARRFAPPARERAGARVRAAVATGATERVPVYDIKVAAGHLPEFFANGVLVHNTTWVPGTDSPDRLDALVHGATDLLKGTGLVQMARSSFRARRAS